MKSRKHVLKIAAFFAVVAMLLGGTISTWARDIKKVYHVSAGNSGFWIELDVGESISKLKVNKKGLKLKARNNNYHEYDVVDKAANDEYNKENKDDPAKAGRTVYVRAFSTKAGKYSVTFAIKKGKKTVKRKQKITVYVGEPLSSVKFAGKTYKTLGKYQGSKYTDPFFSSSSFVTKKSKGKFSAKAGYGYKVVAITYETYNSKTDEWDTKAYKKGSSVSLVKQKGYTDKYDRSYNGTKYTRKYTSDHKAIDFTVYLKDTKDSKNNKYTSKYVKGKYADSYSVSFIKYD